MYNINAKIYNKIIVTRSRFCYFAVTQFNIDFALREQLLFIFAIENKIVFFFCELVFIFLKLIKNYNKNLFIDNCCFKET